MSSKQKQEFDLRLKYLKDIRVKEINQVQEYRGEVPRKPYNLKIFESVLLPLTPEQWISLCMSDGSSYIGGCCGNTSFIQDKINSIFRFDSGWLKISKLAEIADLMINHDDYHVEENIVNFKFLPKRKNKRKNLKQTVEIYKGHLDIVTPWEIIALIWHITKDFYKPEVPIVHGDHVAPLESAVSVLSIGLNALNLDNMFKLSSNITYQDKINKSLVLAKLLPALKTVNEQIDTIYSGQLEGYAIVSKENPQKVVINYLGYCIFSTIEEVEKLLDLWNHNDEEFEEKDSRQKVNAKEKFVVRKVRVSKENGIEFID